VFAPVPSVRTGFVPAATTAPSIVSKPAAVGTTGGTGGFSTLTAFSITGDIAGTASTIGSPQAATPSPGGSSYFGGNGAIGINANGGAGTTYGGGGGGCFAGTSESAHTGGAGGDGVIVVTEYVLS